MTKWIQGSLTACIVLAGVAGTQTLRAQDRSWFEATTPGAYFQLAGLSPASYMGVNLADIDNDRARTLKLRDVHGVEITRIEDNSPAAKAGLKIGDVVLEYNGQRVEGMEQFGRFVRETPAGREVKLVVSRDGNPQTVPVTLAPRKDALRGGATFSSTWPGSMREFHFNMPEINMPEINIDIPQIYSMSRTSPLGVEAESLSPQLAEFFGVKEGVLVRSVVKDSAAEKAGIKAGDVITKVDQEKVTSAPDLSGAIRSARSKATFSVQIVREHREMTLNVTMDRAKSDLPVVPRTRVVTTRPVKI
jgi:serine protease Do